MKAQLVPMYFDPGRDDDFDVQLAAIRRLLSNDAELLEPVALGSCLPKADAVVFPQILGQAYRRVADFRKIDVPILAVTSEFGTFSMWDWEIASFMKENGVRIMMPYSLEQSKTLCRCLAVKRDMHKTKFLVFQDDPGKGFQASIFKRFFWWENECVRLIKDKFGVTIDVRSFREFGAKAKAISDDRAKQVWKGWDLKTESITDKALNSAVKIYIAAREELEKDPAIKGIGSNCLNESHYSDTTPCLAWNMLFEEKNIVWGCEADTMSLLTKYLAHHCLGAPIMMTNIYPFLMGMAALSHEHIDSFPDIDDPDDCILLVHCGYFGIVPSSQSTEWTLRPKVLDIVDDNATAIDARLPVGPVTMVKLGPSLDKIMVVECELEEYVKYPGSHCRNGAVIRVPSGHEVMKKVYSHHQCFLAGKWAKEIELMAQVFALEIESI